MIEKENRIFDYKFYLLLLGIIIILFTSVYIFTRTSFDAMFDLSNKGEIGDAIGGITAPIINLVGAILVYISFQAQINANRIQYKLLNQEVENQRYDRNFSVALELINTLKEDFNSLSYKESKGLSALNIYTNEIKTYWRKENFKGHMSIPIYEEWKFIIHEIDLVMNHIVNSGLRDGEKEKLDELMKLYYITRLKKQTNNIQHYLMKFELENEITEVILGFKKYNN